MQKISTAGNIVAFDTETTGLNYRGEDRPYLYTFTDYAGNSTAIWGDVDPFTRKCSFSEEAYEELKRVLEDPTITKICHNAKFDVGMSQAIGINVLGEVKDTLIYAHVFNSNMGTYGLKPLAERYLNFSQEDMTDLKKAVATARRQAKADGAKIGASTETDYWLVPDLCEKYAIGDTERTMGLYWWFENEYNADKEYANLVDMEHDLLWVTKRMEDRGIRVSTRKIEELRKYYESVQKEELAKIAELGYANLNLNSPVQLKEVFYLEKNKTAVYRVRKGKDGKKTKTASVDSKILAQWASEGDSLAKSIVRYKEAGHQLSSFITTLKEEAIKDKNGQYIIHPNYKTSGPVTGRISCTKPNLMNISNPGEKQSDVQYRVRECFIPRSCEDYTLYFADYSQVEVWVAMYLAQDEFGMSQLESGEDMHGTMALKIWGNRENLADEKVFKKWRKRAKFVLFGLIYGAGIPAVMNAAGCDESEAETIRTIFWKTFKGLSRFSKKLQVEVEKRGYIVNPFGRKYHIPANEAYKALNYMVQGTASEIMKRALINIDSDLPESANLLLTIHDEVCVEALVTETSVPEIIVKAMQGNFKDILGLPCKLQAEISIAEDNWANKKTMETQYND